MPGSSGLPGPKGFGRGSQSPEAQAAAALLPTGARQAANDLASKLGNRGRGAGPLKASAAPTGTNKFTYTGLCDALNAYEKSL